MGDYAKALSCCKSALEIFETELSEIHPLAATSHNNIGLVYANMKKYPEAAASYKHAVDIGQKVLPANHPNLLKYKHNLASVSKKGNK
jgi:tetratricopeptide (TPR) repeat protein